MQGNHIGAVIPNADELERELWNSGDPSLDDEGHEVVALLTCGTCGRRWNDARISATTPAPAARCPFEYEHTAPEPSEHESGIDRARIPRVLRQEILAALSRGTDAYDDVLDAIERHWPAKQPDALERATGDTRR